MTAAPAPLLAARAFIIESLGVPGASVGIVGDGPHARTGSSYHLGRSQLRPDSYSIVESSRDGRGLSEAAAALDVGEFTKRVGGTTHTLRTFSAWLVAQCKAGTPDTGDIREVIYSLDGKTVRRWDRLGRRTSGDSSHTFHTHISYFRDSESRDKTALFRRYLAEIEEDDVAAATDMITLTKDTAAAIGDGTKYKEGDKLSLATLVQLNLIYSSRGNKGTAAIKAAIETQGDDLDEAELAGRIVAAIPDGIAEQVAQKLADRLAS